MQDPVLINLRWMLYNYPTEVSRVSRNVCFCSPFFVVWIQTSPGCILSFVICLLDAWDRPALWSCDQFVNNMSTVAIDVVIHSNVLAPYWPDHFCCHCHYRHLMIIVVTVIVAIFPHPRVTVLLFLSLPPSFFSSSSLPPPGTITSTDSNNTATGSITAHPSSHFGSRGWEDGRSI